MDAPNYLRAEPCRHRRNVDSFTTMTFQVVNRKPCAADHYGYSLARGSTDIHGDHLCTRREVPYGGTPLLTVLCIILPSGVNIDIHTDPGNEKGTGRSLPLDVRFSMVGVCFKRCPPIWGPRFTVHRAAVLPVGTSPAPDRGSARRAFREDGFLFSGGAALLLRGFIIHYGLFLVPRPRPLSASMYAKQYCSPATLM